MAVLDIVIYGDPVLREKAAPVDEIVRRSYGRTRLVTQMLSLFGIVALGMGVVGVYGVAAHSVAKRQREIGIRIALGAEGSKVATRTVVTGLLPVTVGVIVGLGLAWASTRTLGSLLYEVEALDLATFLAVPGLLMAVATLGLVVPAVRAGRVDPAITLREE